MLTNNHVVQDADELKVVLADDRELTAEIVGTDPNTDLAVIKVKDASKLGLHRRPARQLRRAAGRRVGDGDRQPVRPRANGERRHRQRGRAAAASASPTTRTSCRPTPRSTRATAAARSSTSRAEVIGINTAIASQTGGYQGVGFAIPVNMARTVMDQLIAHGAVVRGYMGVYITDVSEELARSFGYKGSGGVLVQDVSPDGPAAKAGLKAGDIVTERDGKPIHDVVAFRNAIAQTAPGSQVTLKVFRNGKEQTLKVKLEELPSQGEARRNGHGGRRAFGQGRPGSRALRPDARPQAAARDQARRWRGRHRGRARLAGRNGRACSLAT